MVKFLINRPIAVCITFLSLSFLGFVALKKLPVSLLPDVPIPAITVKAENKELAAQEMESIVTNQLRRYLLQCNSLKDISSVTKDGSCVIILQFEYGINTSVAAIDVNEKIDRSMGSLPNTMERPRVFKASATDIPVFYLNLSYKANQEQNGDIIELSEFARNVIRRRLEQLEEVAMVDITGTTEPRINIKLRTNKVATIGLEPYHFEKVFNDNNMEMGSIQVKEGYYTYSVRLSNKQWGIEELKLLPVSIDERIFMMGELAEINIDSEEKQGAFLTGGKHGISLAVIKQSDAKVSDLKKNLNKTLNLLKKETPRISIEITRDQITLLDYSISGLKQSLIIGAILAFLIIFAFLADIRQPLIMGMILPVSIIIAFLFLMLFNISLNIISLSGIILAVGMMIDNSIIVIDNIAQYRERGENIANSTVKATNEVIRPLLSSALTTCAVFIPLVFISGMAGSLFMEQAITVSIGLGVSFCVSITLLPTLYFLFFKRKNKSIKQFHRREFVPLSGAYNRGFDFVFKNRTVFLTVFLLCIVGTVLLYQSVEKESFPMLTQNEATVKIEWNESINFETNLARTEQLIDTLLKNNAYIDAWVGVQQYMLVRDFSDELNVSYLWINSNNQKELKKSLHTINHQVNKQYLVADVSIMANSNVFDKTFLSHKPDFELRVYNENNLELLGKIKQLRDSLTQYTRQLPENKIKENEYILLRYDAVKLSLYGIPPMRLINTLRTKLKSHHIGYYNAFNQQIPVVISEDEKTLNDILTYETIQDKDSRDIPLKAFLTIETAVQPSVLTAGADGAYFGLQYKLNSKELKKTEKGFIQVIQKYFPELKFDFKGQVYDNKKLISELTVILLISVLLLYFILAAQFESLKQPLIVLLEIPIDIAGALLLLKLFGASLNIMSSIGIIVMCGIIINDSILKIDTINRLRRDEGMNLMQAIHEGGNRRLRPIIMTSLTTILALVPFFFGLSMGIELQRPLALAVIGGLGVGTLVSLYFIPLLYWFLYRKSEKTN